MINKILEYFGLMRISRAKNIFIGLCALKEREIMRIAQEDFNAIPKLNFEEEVKEWASTAWEQAMEDKTERYWYLSESEARIQGYLD